MVDSHPRMLEALKRFRVLLRSMETHYRQVESKAGLGGAQLWALTEIAQSRGLTVGTLAGRLAIELPTASNLVRRLEELRLVTRERDPDDKRVVKLKATPAGQRKVKRAPGPPMGLLQQALLQMSARELDSLCRQLDVVLRKLQHLDPRGQSALISVILTAARRKEG